MPAKWGRNPVTGAKVKIVSKKTPAKKAPAKKTSAKKTPAKKAPAKKMPAGDLLRGIELVDIALKKRARTKKLVGMTAEQLAAIDFGGKPLSPALAHWLAHDSEMVNLGPARSLMELIDGELPEYRDSFVELAKVLSGPCVLFVGWGSDSRRFLYLGVTDDHGEYPVFTVDTDDMAYACINGPVDVWLAQHAGALAPEKEYGTVPPAYEPARKALADKCLKGNLAYLEGALCKHLDPYA